jgi:hypothetical protein
MIIFFGIISIAIGAFYLDMAVDDFEYVEDFITGLAQTLIGVAFILIGIGLLFSCP